MKGGGAEGGCFPTGRHYPGIAHLIRVSVEGLATEWGPETDLAEIPWVSIDTETTGRDAKVDRVVEVGFVYMKGDEIIDRKGWLINPECPIPVEASNVHGILDADVASKPAFAEVADEIFEALHNVLPHAYNADFDKGFVCEEFQRVKKYQSIPDAERPPALRANVQWVDPLDWARELHKEHKSRALGAVCERLGIDLENAHRATDDAEASGHVMAAFLKDSRVPRPYGALIKEQRRLARQFEFERVRWR